MKDNVVTRKYKEYQNAYAEVQHRVFETMGFPILDFEVFDYATEEEKEKIDRLGKEFDELVKQEFEKMKQRKATI